MSIDLEAIKARCAAATLGPWTAENEVDHSGFDQSKLWIVMRNEPCAYKFDRREDAEFAAAARTDVPALVAEVERLHFLLAECYRATGADPDGNDDAMLARHALVKVKMLREEADSEGARADAAEARVAELERDLADTNRVRADYDHDRREAREALKVAQDRLGELAAAVIAHEDAEFACGMYANIASPKYADLIESRKRLRTLLAKGGAA